MSFEVKLWLILVMLFVLLFVSIAVWWAAFPQEGALAFAPTW